MAGYGRCTKIVSHQRTMEALNLRLRGAEHQQINQRFQELGWHLSFQQVCYYVKRADRLIESQIETDKDALLRYHIVQRRRIFSLALSQNDLATAARILKDEGELQGLYPAKKSEISGPGGAPIQHAHAHLDIVAAMDQAGISLETRKRMLTEMASNRTQPPDIPLLPPPAGTKPSEEPEEEMEPADLSILPTDPDAWEEDPDFPEDTTNTEPKPEPKSSEYPQTYLDTLLDSTEPYPTGWEPDEPTEEEDLGGE